MSYFGEHFWGDKNHGFEVLYHCVKQGPVATKELADFIRERANIEETYSKAMAKLSKLASNGTPMGTFAPLWEVFRVSSDKLALCHLELTRKLHDLLKDVLRYGEEQLKTHKKCKEEVLGTVDAVQMLSGVGQLLPKSRENYLSRCMDLERLRRENTSQKEMDKAETKSKKAADSLRRSVDKYNSARADFEIKMLLRYQFSRPGPESVPLQMSAHWQCGPTLTRVSVEYSYRAGATAVSTPLTNVQILLPQAGLRGQEHPFQPGSANSSVHKQALAFSIL